MTRSQAILVIIAVLALLAVAMAWFQPEGQSGNAVRLEPDNGAVIARGAVIYQAECVGCHGVNLEGQPNWQSPGADGLMPAPPHDATGHTWHHADGLLFDLTKYGLAKTAGLDDYQSAMPTYEDVLTDEEIIAVLSWIKAQWPDDVRKRHDALNASYLERTRQ